MGSLLQQGHAGKLVSRGIPKAWGGSDEGEKTDRAGWTVTSDQHCPGAHSKDTGLRPVSIPLTSESLYLI